jgi:UDP-glucose 4-epimerase
MHILVTGGAGYIGSHTAIELLNAGYSVTVVDNLSNSSEESLKRVEKITEKTIQFYAFDLRDKSKLDKVFKENAFDAVIHFAGLKAVGESVSEPLKYYDNNLVSTLRLCEAMDEYDVRKLVFSSSATVYGDPTRVPIEEDFPIHATNPYGQTKAVIEQILVDLATSAKGWQFSILRYFNPVGAHESGMIGEDPQGIPSNLLPFVSQVAIGTRDKLQIYGGDYPTHDGTGVRDYIHVVDLAKGHVAALKHMPAINTWEAYNLGTGKGYSVLDVIAAFEKVSGVQIPYQIVSRRPGDVASCFALPTKAKIALYWQAEKSLQEACEDAWRWQSKNPNGYAA